MPMFISDNGYVNYVRSGYAISDTHGGKSDIHRIEIEEICNDIINQKLKEYNIALSENIEKYVDEKINQIIDGVMDGLQYDVNVIASVSIDSVGEVYRKEQVKKEIASAIYKQLKNAISKRV